MHGDRPFWCDKAFARLLRGEMTAIRDDIEIVFDARCQIEDDSDYTIPTHACLVHGRGIKQLPIVGARTCPFPGGPDRLGLVFSNEGPP